MINHLHAKCLSLLLQIPSDPTHTQYPQYLPLGIMAEWGWLLAAPVAVSEVD